LSVTRCGRLTAKAMTSAMSCGGMDQSRAFGDPLAGGVGDVVGEFRRGGAGLDDDDPDVGLQLDAQCLRPAVDPPLGRRVGGEAGRCDPTGDRGDVH